MKQRKIWIATIAFALAVIGWALFRPELLFVNNKVNEAFPAAQASSANGSVALLTGKFHGVAHQTKGTATIHRLADGHHVLRLTDFETSNGPDVRVFLIGANDASDNATVKKEGFVEVAKLKGNIGDQNYDLPADLDLNRYHAVTIWCNRFGVNFATAPLMAEQAAANNGPVRLAEGSFHGVAHQTNGMATLYQLTDGMRLLRLTHFSTSNGPDVRVYLVAAADAKDSATVKNAGFVELGKLKGNEGDQNYEVPASLDLNKYRAVTIWCARFGVNFATAPLMTNQG